MPPRLLADPIVSAWQTEATQVGEEGCQHEAIRGCEPGHRSRRKIRAYYDAEMPKRHPNYPLVGPDEEDPPPPPEEEQLRDFLATLPDDMIYQLILIEHLGRGDVHADDLAGYFGGLKDSIGDREEAVAQMMMDETILADELSDALEELRKHKINVDRMPLQKMKARKR